MSQSNAIIEKIQKENYIFIAGSEEDCKTLKSLELPATTVKDWQEEFNEHLREAEVYILPSKQEDCLKVAKDIYSFAETIKFVKFPTLTPWVTKIREKAKEKIQTLNYRTGAKEEIELIKQLTSIKTEADIVGGIQRVIENAPKWKPATASTLPLASTQSETTPGVVTATIQETQSGPMSGTAPATCIETMPVQEAGAAQEPEAQGPEIGSEAGTPRTAETAAASLPIETMQTRPSKGWVLLHRKIINNPIWTSEKFSQGQSWIDLILLAAYESKAVILRPGISITLKRGELAWSQRHLAERWRWNQRTVSRFLKRLESEGMLQHRKNRYTTIISITKYNQYQESTALCAARNTALKKKKSAALKIDQSAARNEPINTGALSAFSSQDAALKIDQSAARNEPLKIDQSANKEVKEGSKEVNICDSPKDGEPLHAGGSKTLEPPSGEKLLTPAQPNPSQIAATQAGPSSLSPLGEPSSLDLAGTPPPSSNAGEGSATGPKPRKARKAGNPKPKKQTDARIKEVIDYFFVTCQEIKGFEPNISGKDAKNAERVLKTIELPELKECIRFFFTLAKSDEHPNLAAALTADTINSFRASKAKGISRGADFVPQSVINASRKKKKLVEAEKRAKAAAI